MEQYDIEKNLGVLCAVDSCPYFSRDDDNNCSLDGGPENCEDYTPHYKTNHFGEMVC